MVLKLLINMCVPITPLAYPGLTQYRFRLCPAIARFVQCSVLNFNYQQGRITGVSTATERPDCALFAQYDSKHAVLFCS